MRQRLHQSPLCSLPVDCSPHSPRLAADNDSIHLNFTEQGVHSDGLDTVEGRDAGTGSLLDDLDAYLDGAR